MTSFTVQFLTLSELIETKISDQFLTKKRSCLRAIVLKIKYSTTLIFLKYITFI